jgi:hypothetical protein
MLFPVEFPDHNPLKEEGMSSTAEEKRSLPTGHPEAGYLSPDKSFTDGAGTFPPEEQEERDEREKAREAEVKAIEDHEDEVARREAEEAAGEETTEAPKPRTRTSSGSE